MTCLGQTSLGCTDPNSCNYNSVATEDDGSCDGGPQGCDTCSDQNDGSGIIIDNPEIGTACDDGDPNTTNDIIQSDCSCAGLTPEDPCANPIPSEAVEFGTANSFIEAFLSDGEEQVLCDGTTRNAVYFSFVAQHENDLIQAGTHPQLTTGFPTGFDAVIQVWENCYGNLIGCYDNYGPNELERIVVGGLVPGQTYYYSVSDKNQGTSTSEEFDVSVKTYVKHKLRFNSCEILNFELGDLAFSERDDLGELYENPAVNVSGYGFEVSFNGDIVALATNYSSSGYMIINGNNGFQINQQYDVRVRHRVQMNANGGTNTFWSDYGESCAVGLLSPDDVVFGCTDPISCNFNEFANADDGSCDTGPIGCSTCSGETDGTGSLIETVEIGSACDDGNPLTFNDVFQVDCQCAGLPQEDPCAFPASINLVEFGPAVGYVDFDLTNASSQVICDGSLRPTHYFKFTAQSPRDIIQAGVHVTLTPNFPTEFDAVIQVWDYCYGTLIGCYDNYGPNQLERVMPGNLVPGQQYYYSVSDKNSGQSLSNQYSTVVKTFVNTSLNSASCDRYNYSLGDIVTSLRDDLGQLYVWPSVVTNGYGFNIRQGLTNISAVSNQSTTGYNLNLNAANGFEEGELYEVRVRHRVKLHANGALGSFWSSYGPPCDVGFNSNLNDFVNENESIESGPDDFLMKTLKSPNRLQVYPNPSDGTGLSIRVRDDLSASALRTLMITDISGRLISSNLYQVSEDGSAATIQFSRTLNKGVYLIQLVVEGESLSSPFVVQ